MRLRRAQFLGGAAGVPTGLGFLRFPAGAAEFTYKWGHIEPATHPMGIRAQEAVNKIAQDSGGQIEIKIFPNYQLGSDASMMTQLRAGALEFQTLSNNAFAQVVPVTGILFTPFVFDGYPAAWRTVDGQLGGIVRDAIRKANLYVFEKAWDAGYKQLMNQVRPVSKPDDVKGLKIRISPGPVGIATFKALGATPVPVPGDQIYVSLQTKLVDGLDAGLSGYEHDKFYEVAKYVAMTNHGWTGLMTIANPDAMQRLPAKVREAVERRFNESALLERSDIQRDDQGLTTALRDRGASFTRIDTAAFRGVLRSAGLYEQWRDQYGPEAWTALERSVGKLT